LLQIIQFSSSCSNTIPDIRAGYAILNHIQQPVYFVSIIRNPRSQGLCLLRIIFFSLGKLCCYQGDELHNGCVVKNGTFNLLNNNPFDDTCWLIVGQLQAFVCRLVQA